MRGLLIAAPQSGSGKTIFTQALVRLLVVEEHTVIPAKAGPDYIDTAHLGLAAGGEAINLDPWAMRGASLRGLVWQAEQRSASADPLLIVEGAMGLFDGAVDGTGSGADLAARFGLPIVLVVNVGGQSMSVAALVQGFVNFRPDLKFAGVVLNKVGSSRHAEMLVSALKTHCPSLPILGCVPRDSVFALPERHLGLVQAQELDDHHRQQQSMAALLAEHIALDSILQAAAPVNLQDTDDSAPLLPLHVQSLAIAQDQAFSFLYHGQLRAWQQAGHEILPFSPLNDESPDRRAEAVFLPGGYPELHGARLSSARNFHAGIWDAKQRGVLIYGECGGYMTMGQRLIDLDGNSFPMLGLLPVDFQMQNGRKALGYRQLAVQCDQLFARKDEHLRAHEFHYARAQISDTAVGAPMFISRDAQGKPCAEQGLCQGRVMGSFMHALDRASP